MARTLDDLGVKVTLADRSWHRLRTARQTGLKTFYGEILSEFAEESVEVGHVRTVLAATDNDAYNALVCSALAPEIGRGRVFQLPMGPGAEEDPKAVAIAHRGRLAFGEGAQFENLWRELIEGWVFTKTPLTEAYTYGQWRADTSADAIPIMLLKANAQARFLGGQNAPETEPGDVLVCFGPARPVADRPAGA